MNSLTDPAVSFIIVLLIGILAGCLAQWVTGTSWLSKQITGTGRVYATSALVGVAGSFIGFHIASLLRLSASRSIVPFISAAVGAAVIPLGLENDKALTALTIDSLRDNRDGGEAVFRRVRYLQFHLASEVGTVLRRRMHADYPSW